MRISVVIPVHNGEAFLAQAIRSVRDQSLPPAEIIVADNNSTDASADIAHSFGPPVRVISAPRKGASAARLAGVAETTGDALMFLDADDLVAPDTLAHLASALRGRGAAMACCPWRRYELVGDCWRAGPASCAPRARGQDDLAAWLTGWYHPPCSILWTREGYDASGGWDASVKVNNDGDVVMRALVADVPLIRASGGIGYYRRLPGGETSLSGRANDAEGLASRLYVLERIEARLDEAGRTGCYAAPLAKAYKGVAEAAATAQLDDTHERAERAVARNGGFGTLRRVRHQLAVKSRRAKTEEASRTVPGTIKSAGATVEANPLVSIILPTYNRSATLGRAVDSVLAQSHSHFELLVIDDGSTDSTPTRMKAITDRRVRYIRQKQNAGVAAARNLGLDAARGPLIAFLDSDDAWVPDKLARQVKRMQDAPARVGLIYTGLVIRQAGGRQETWTPWARGNVLAEILRRNIVHFGTSSTMIRADAAETVGGFDTSLPANEDHDYWARIARFYEFDFDPDPLTIYDQGGEIAGVEAKRSKAFARNMRARDLFVERHGFEAARLDATFAYQMDSARRHLEWDEGDTRAGRRLLLKAARAAPSRSLPYLWLALSFLPPGLRSSGTAGLRRLRHRMAQPQPVRQVQEDV